MSPERGVRRKPAVVRWTLVRALAICVLAEARTVNAQSAPAAPASQDARPQASEPTTTDPVVVTASRYEEQLVNAPATMTVISEADIRRAPAQTIAELLRLVPGINVAQLAVRDVNITSRTATATLSNSLLVLLDGRSIYQDFFGAVLWDFLPIDTTEIKQIEVIRGPASAVWGANALTGVVNVITKTPRELAGTTVTARMGLVDRTRQGDRFENGALFAANAVHAAAPNDRFAFKISAGVLAHEAFLRPIGTVPGTAVQFPPFQNSGTSQPRLDVRTDYDFGTRRRLTIAAGVAGTAGIIHTGLGPFDIQTGSTLSYGRVTYWRNRLKLQAFANALEAEAPVLLQAAADGAPIHSTYANQVYDVELSNQHLLGTRHLISYGGNYRRNRFNLSLAPGGENRDEGGAYVQDQVFLSERLRLVLGTRLDIFDNLDKAVVSPRTALLVHLRPTHTLRFSFNRSFRSPSFVNNYFNLDLSNSWLDTSIRYRSTAVGNPRLREEQLTAYETGYIGIVGTMTLGAAIYLNHLDDIIYFTPDERYSPMNPPQDWSGTEAELSRFLASNVPSRYTYENFARSREWGIELSLAKRLTTAVGVFANYTWQAPPDLGATDVLEVNHPPRHRVNAGLDVEGRRYFGSVTATIQDGAFWQDVLDPVFRARTPPYAVVNGSFGVRSSDGTLSVAFRGTNLLNHNTRQHAFGDLIKRTLATEVRLSF